jgi:hypothetical protein
VPEGAAYRANPSLIAAGWIHVFRPHRIAARSERCRILRGIEALWKWDRSSVRMTSVIVACGETSFPHFQHRILACRLNHNVSRRSRVSTVLRSVPFLMILHALRSLAPPTQSFLSIHPSLPTHPTTPTQLATSSVSIVVAAASVESATWASTRPSSP